MFDFYVTVQDDEHKVQLTRVEKSIKDLFNLVIKGDKRIMATLAEMQAELVSANEATNEIASDLDVLLGRLDSPGLTEDEEAQVLSDISALKSRLQGVASKFTPDAVIE